VKIWKSQKSIITITIVTTQESQKKKNFILGFTDEDLEKPNFSRKKSSEKVPFILSDVGNPPVVQVSPFILLQIAVYIFTV
jgi:hypothetical protein